jgi:site-specific DNA recombinase
MQKAALYARVSSDAQQKEGTIESQVAELKRQIAAAGHILVKEYIDDGVPGPLLDRPALNELRADAKRDAYEVVYFLDADRIARVVAYQTIIIEELISGGTLRHSSARTRRMKAVVAYCRSCWEPEDGPS